MRGAVGAEEEAAAAGGRRRHQSLPVLLALEDRQAVPVRPHAAGEQGIAVVEQMVRGQRRRGVRAGFGDVLGALLRGDVLEHDLQSRKAAPQTDQVALDEDRLAVEHVDLGIGHLAVHQQDHALALGRLQHPGDLPEIGDAGVAVGGGARGIELDRRDAGRARPAHLVGRGAVGQVERHQRLERRARGQGLEDPPAVGERLLDPDDRRPEVRHDDRPRELASAVRQHRGEGGAVAQMQVPVVGADDADRFGHRRILPSAAGTGGRSVLQDLGQEILGAGRARLGIAEEIVLGAILQDLAARR